MCQVAAVSRVSVTESQPHKMESQVTMVNVAIMDQEVVQIMLFYQIIRSLLASPQTAKFLCAVYALSIQMMQPSLYS